MRVIIAAYPPDWSLKETLAVPVFLDEVPLKGDAGRVDFRLKGLINGLILEELFEGNGDWLLIDEKRSFAPRVFLITIHQDREFGLDKVARWFAKAVSKLVLAGARDCSILVKDLYRHNFTVKEFSEVIIKNLINQPFLRVKLYTGFELAEILTQEMGRWLAHLKPDNKPEIEIDFLPEFLEDR